MAQKTFVAGDVLTASDVNTYLAGEGGAWTTYTPTLTQSGAVTKTVTYARYARFGRLIVFIVRLDVTGTGSANNAITISLPVTASVADVTIPGGGFVRDNSATTNYPGVSYLASTTTVSLIPTASNTNGVSIGQAEMTAALANTDVVEMAGVYEAAS